MAIVVLPYLLTDGTTAFGDQVYANDLALANAYNGGIDNTNIGPAGIYASQIIPTSPSQATFGGTQTYVFPAGIQVTGSIQASTSGIASFGTITATNFVASGVGNLTCGSSSYGPTGATVVGTVNAQGFAASLTGVTVPSNTGTAPNNTAHTPGAFTQGGSDYGQGVKVVLGPVNGSPITVGNGATTASASVVYSGAAVFTTNPQVFVTFIAGSVAGWSQVTANVSANAITGFTVAFVSAGAASSAQTGFFFWAAFGV
jgi:hypothetical protein